jgi:glutamate dehydrogenase (NAD(P)+)
LQTITDQYGAIDKDGARAAGYRLDDGENWLRTDVDVLIPAALEGSINADNVDQISARVRLVAEGANGPTTPEADQKLFGRRIFLIPDFLCNAGGVVVSYLEGVQNAMNYYWSRQEVMARLDEKMSQAFDEVFRLAQREEVDMRDAAYMFAVGRVVQAMEMRGWLFVP